MSTKHPHVPASSTEANRRLDVTLQRYLDMDLRTWKTIKAGLVTLALFAFGVYSVNQGAEPTTTFAVAATVSALLNGVELAELVAALADSKGSGASNASDQHDE